MAALTTQTIVRLASTYRLQWEAAQESYVLLYPEGMITLNSSAGDILSRCDGIRSLAEIIADLRCTYPEAGTADEMADDVLEFVEIAHHEGWLCIL